MSPPAAPGSPASLIAGQQAEARALKALNLPKNTDIWRPTPDQMLSQDFRAIVGEARFTATGLARGTVLDSVVPNLAEIKSGGSPLEATYQLRLQAYRALIENRRLTIYSNRPVQTGFGHWLVPRGVALRPLPPEPEPG